MNLTTVYQQLDDVIRQGMASNHTPSLAQACTDRNASLWSGAYGWADLAERIPLSEDHLFAIGSIGKTFTAIAVLQACETGKMDLSHPISFYLPWLELPRGGKDITLHHLLTHTSGLPEGTDFSPDGHGEVFGIRSLTLACPPGEHFYYSNLGFKLLGLALETAVERPYPEIIRHQILEPLEMEATEPALTQAMRARCAKGYEPFFDDRPPNFSHPLVEAPWIESATGDGCIASNAADMAKFVRMLLNRGHGPRRRLLTPQSFELLTAHHSEQDSDYDYGYGLTIFQYDGLEHVGHGGDIPGYEAYIWTDLDTGLGTVTLMAHPYVRNLAFYSLRLLRAGLMGQDLPEPNFLWGDPARITNPGDYAGDYHSPRGDLSFTATNDQLWLELEDGPVVLERLSEDTFLAPHPDFELFPLRFARRKRGSRPNLVIELFHGPDWYINDEYTGPLEHDIPPDWAAFPGHYRAHNPWLTNFRIVFRKGQLWFIYPDGDEVVLVQVKDDLFQLGEEECSPERLHFDWIVNNQALKVNYSGCEYYRFFTK